MPKPKETKRKAIQSRHKNAFKKKLRKQITLNEYMPVKFKSKDVIPIPCYQIEEDGENDDNIDQVAFQARHSSIAKIHFFDKDILLGSTPHNRPLFIVGYICEQMVNHILIDYKSSINLHLLKMMKDLEVSLDELSPSQLIIQGFNQHRQRAFGKVMLKLFIKDMELNALFHVIDDDKTYNMLLGRPWLHRVL